jgi:hypothetical protein
MRAPEGTCAQVEFAYRPPLHLNFFAETELFSCKDFLLVLTPPVSLHIILHRYLTQRARKDISLEWTVCNFENSLSPTHFFWRTHTNTRQNNGNDGVPSSSPFIIYGRHPERPPRRAALPISSADSVERSVAARWSGAAPELSSGRFAAVVTVI